MAMNRAVFAKQLEPGLNTLFGHEYKQYPEQWRDIFDYNTSVKAFEEDVLLEGFGAAATKNEGSAITYDTAAELWTARYNHDTIALAFSLTEEAEEDGLYGSLGKRYVKAMARSMAHTKEIKGANILNNGFDNAYTGGDGLELLSTAHVSTSGIPAALTGMCLVLPTALQFVGERLLKTQLRTATAENDINAVRSGGYLSGGYKVNQRLVDTDAWFIKTDCPDGMKVFQRRSMKNGMEGDFETGNVRYKCSERYSFGWTDWRGVYGSPGA